VFRGEPRVTQALPEELGPGNAERSVLVLTKVSLGAWTTREGARLQIEEGGYEAT